MELIISLSTVEKFLARVSIKVSLKYYVGMRIRELLFGDITQE